MPVAVTIDSSQIRTGPGIIRFAPLGSALPTMAVANSTFLADTWPVAWLEVGPTDSGFQTTHSTDTDKVEVEESLYAVRTETTGKTDAVSFTLAADNLRTMKLAMNGGVVLTTGSTVTTLNKYSPPLIGNEVRVMIGWESDDNKVRQIFYQCFQTGSPNPERRKGTAKAAYGLEFAVELPAPAVASTPWNRWDAGVATV